MCSEIECYIYATTYYPPNTSGQTTQCIWPLFLYHISFCWALHFSSFCFPLPLYHSLTFSNASHVSALLVFLLLNRSLVPANISYFAFDIFFFLFLLFDLISPLSVCSCLDPSTSHMFHPTMFVIPPPSPPFVFLSRRSSCGQCGHYRRGTAAPAGGGGLPPRWVCQCLLPRFTGAAEPGRELHAHPGLRALWHR